MNVIKRNGETQELNEEKVLNAISKAFESVRGTTEVPSVLKSDVAVMVHNTKESISVETIQDEVENILMTEGYHDVAKAYILYREQHKQARLANQKLVYIKKYTNATVANASLSNTDDNANSNKKNAAALEGELYKDTSRVIQRNQMKELLVEIGSPYANQYVKDLEHHIIYQHDESCPVLKPYCSAYTLYPLLLDGTTNVDGTKNHAPKHLSSFCGQFQNLVFLLSAQKKGAGAYGEFFNFFSYFCEKEWGKNYWQKEDVVITTEHCAEKRTIGSTIDQYFQSVTHYINQPASNRGYQSPFTNFNVFDSYYWHTMFDGFTFPDGEKANWDAVNWLQKRYMKWLNKERTKTLLTFPIMTVCALTDGKEVLDKEYKDFITEQWAEGDSFFVYLSENADSISSCCFSKDTKVLWKNSYDGVKCTTLEELHNLKWKPFKENLKIFHNGSWVKGKSIKLPCRDMYKVTTFNNKTFYMTDNHINLTLAGEKQTSELSTEDYLLFNTQVLNRIPEKDEGLTYAEGIMVGAFLGDGTISGYVCQDGSIHSMDYSLNEEKFKKLVPYLDQLQEKYNMHYSLNSIYNNVYSVKVNSKEFIAFIIKWTNWAGHTTAISKDLNLNCLLQSVEFRKGILDGWYITDGGNSNRCYTVSEKLKDAMEMLITSLGMQSIIDISDRTDENVIIRGEYYNRNYPLYCVRFYTDTNHRVCKNTDHSWIKKNNSLYFRVKSIEKIDYQDSVYCIECNNENEPFFTLPSGLITHNCRLRNEINDNTFSSTTGLTGVQTGSCNVITLNLNRIVQDWAKTIKSTVYKADNTVVETHKMPRRLLTCEWHKNDSIKAELEKYLKNILDRVYHYQKAYKTGLYKMDELGMFPQTKAGYISFDKLYCTLGVNGLNEAARFLGYKVSNNEAYMNFASWLLSIINDYNKKKSTKKFKFNLELVPAESLGVKNYNWDKEDGYWVPEDENLYNSYIYEAHDDTSILDKIAMQGGQIAKSITGGQASHLNLQDNLSKEQYAKLLDYAVSVGNNYITFNVPQTQCDDCGFIVKHPFDICPKCGSSNHTMWTRIIGYLRPMKAWSEARQLEGTKRVFKTKEEC